jgi:hypothetical protein
VFGQQDIQRRKQLRQADFLRKTCYPAAMAIWAALNRAPGGWHKITASSVGAAVNKVPSLPHGRKMLTLRNYAQADEPDLKRPGKKTHFYWRTGWDSNPR